MSNKDRFPEFNKHFAGIFMEVLNDAAKVYESHIPEKGEDWLLDSIDQQLSQWISEVGEVLALVGSGKYNPHLCRKELLDVINHSLMLAKLIDEKA